MREIKAIGFKPNNQVDSLEDIHIAMPIINQHDLLVKVQAVSVNPIDIKVRKTNNGLTDNYCITGFDAAGIVERIGSAVTNFIVGDEVFYAGAINRQGANSEYHAVDSRIVGIKPRTLDFAHAAAMPLTSLTAYESLFERLAININANNHGKSILIIGGAGGVGSIAIQLAKLAGIQTIATASRVASKDWCLKLGADLVINHSADMQQELKAHNIHAVDYVLCTNNTDMYFEFMSDIIKPFGKIVALVDTANHVNLKLLKVKSATFAWEFMFTKSMFETDDMISQREILNHISALFDDGKLLTTAVKVFDKINANNLMQAYKLIEQGNMIGKVVLSSF